MNKQDAPARIEANSERPAHPSRQFFPFEKKSPRGGSRSRTGFAERHPRDCRNRTPVRSNRLRVGVGSRRPLIRRRDRTPPALRS